MTDNLIQLGALAVIFFVAIKEFFGYLKSRKNGSGLEDVVKRVLANASDNHLHELPEVIRALNRIEEKLDRQFERINEKLDKIPT